jgi:hypothetical protein
MIMFGFTRHHDRSVQPAVQPAVRDFDMSRAKANDFGQIGINVFAPHRRAMGRSQCRHNVYHISIYRRRAYKQLQFEHMYSY